MQQTGYYGVESSLGVASNVSPRLYRRKVEYDGYGRGNVLYYASCVYEYIVNSCMGHRGSGTLDCDILLTSCSCTVTVSYEVRPSTANIHCLIATDGDLLTVSH